jgi:hypothetical protein
VALEFEVAIGQALDAEFSVLPLVSIAPLSLNAEDISFQSNPDPRLLATGFPACLWTYRLLGDSRTILDNTLTLKRLRSCPTRKAPFLSHYV